MESLAFAFVFVAGFALAAMVNFVGLRSFRRTRGAHWSERARMFFPAHVAAKTQLWLAPLIVVALRRLFLPEAPVHIVAEISLALCGVILGSWFFDKEAFPWLTWSIWVREVLLSWGVMVLRFAVYLAAISLIGVRVEWHDVLIAAGVIAYDLWLAFGGLLRILRRFGLFPDAPERVQVIVREVCERMNVPVPPVFSCSSTTCNAYAFFAMKSLIFTDVLIERLSDAELRGIAAHEVAHLHEGRAAHMLRFVAFLAIWPVIFVRPLYGVFGGNVIPILLIWWWLVQVLMSSFGRRMEARADKAAVEMDASQNAEYATGLARIYETNMVPAVMPSGRKTHPDLYDRMVAAGITPDFPRPRAPRRFGIHLVLLIAAFFYLSSTQLDDVHRKFTRWLRGR